jgi:hypothetical protein
VGLPVSFVRGEASDLVGDLITPDMRDRPESLRLT